MSASLGLLAPFDPIAAEWPRCPAAHPATPDRGAVGYRGGPLPGIPAAPAASRWRDSLLRWLAEMPREMPPLD